MSYLPFQLSVVLPCALELEEEPTVAIRGELSAAALALRGPFIELVRGSETPTTIACCEWEDPDRTEDLDEIDDLDIIDELDLIQDWSYEEEETIRVPRALLWGKIHRLQVAGARA